MGSAQRLKRPLIPPKKQGGYTYADCLEWPEDFCAEVIDGVVYEMIDDTELRTG